MEANQKRSLGQRWEEWRPSKALLFWSCAACIVLTMIVGFSWGGWVTGGTAREMVEDEAEAARHQLAAALCVDRFMATAEARASLAELQEISSSYRRGEFIEEGDWALMPGAEQVDDDVAELCAEQLAEMELPPAQEATAVEDAAVVAQ